MKTLILFRHAKSDWDAGVDDDHARPLNKRGRKAAVAMGRFLALARQVPTSIVTSSAVRARETLEIASEAGAWKSATRVESCLYLPTPEAALEVARAEPDSTESLLLVGHEPTWSELVAMLGGGRVRFPTAAMVRLDLSIGSWKDAAGEAATLRWFVPPKLVTKWIPE